MKIKASNLTKPLQLTLSGDEPWLLPIYESFASGPSQARLSGSLEVRRESSGFVHVSGRIRVTPYVECSRCADPIPWPIDEAIDATFRPEHGSAALDERGGRRRGKRDEFAAAEDDDSADSDASRAQREIQLTRADLDEYVMHGGEVDLAELINDTVQLAVPLQTVRSDPTGSSCSICGIDLTSDLVYGTTESVRKIELPVDDAEGDKPGKSSDKSDGRKKKSGSSRAIRSGNLPEHLH